MYIQYIIDISIIVIYHVYSPIYEKISIIMPKQQKIHQKYIKCETLKYISLYNSYYYRILNTYTIYCAIIYTCGCV